MSTFDPLMRISTVGPQAVPETHGFIRAWIESHVFQDLLRAFSWTDNPNLPLNGRIDSLVTQSEEWDFRRRTARAESMGASTESTRWTSHGGLLTESQSALAQRAGREMNMASASKPSRNEYRAVLVLGGARLSCLLRTQWAAQLLNQGVTVQDVVLIGSERPVADSERDATDTYAPGARTEFDLFVDAGSSVFGYEKRTYSGERHDDAVQNRSWEIREYNTAAMKHKTLVISAPSSDPKNRRSNSADTYKFYIEREQLAPGSQLLLVTSPIYVPYQQLEAIRVIAVPLNIHVETIGFPPEWHAQMQGMQGPQHYLQEMRSFLQSSQRFLSAYPA